MTEPVHNEDYLTPDYLAGTKCLYEGKLPEAIAAFARIPADALCWVMGQGNICLALVRMARYAQAEEQLRNVLAEIEGRGCPYPPAYVQFMRNLAEAIGGQHRLA